MKGSLEREHKLKQIPTIPWNRIWDAHAQEGWCQDLLGDKFHFSIIKAPLLAGEGVTPTFALLPIIM